MKLFGYRVERIRRPPTDPPPALSGYLTGETKADRIERIYADATELLRRAYAGLEWSRRPMQPLGMGARRWSSANAFLLHAGAIRTDGALANPDQVIARRCLSQCRDHHLYALKQGRYAPPF